MAVKKALTIAALSSLFFAGPALALQGNYSWTNPVDANRTGIKVLRGTGADPVTFTQQGATLAASATSFNDPLTGISLGTRICVKIVPTGTLGDDPNAVQVCGTPATPVSVNGITIIFQP
jgi:hypothetical protein